MAFGGVRYAVVEAAVSCGVLVVFGDLAWSELGDSLGNWDAVVTGYCR